MKIKAIVLVAAAVLAMGTAALAKDKGTLSKFPNWGVITVPDDIYMQSGRQPMLTAADEGNDVIALFERIFPIQPETYQVVKKDDADFQYAYLLHYTATIWDVKAAVYGENRENSYLRDIGSRPDMRILMNRLNQNMPGRVPEGFRVVSPVTAKKTNGISFMNGPSPNPWSSTAIPSRKPSIAWPGSTVIRWKSPPSWATSPKKAMTTSSAPSRIC